MADISIKELNLHAAESPTALIADAERKYHGFIERLADRIAKDDKVRIVLLAGPSGSGKTTTANTLSDALKTRGLDSLVVSLDDFYRDAGDPAYPRLPDGTRDYEAPEALNLSDVSATLSAIAEGEPFTVPNYNFKIAARDGGERYAAISHGCVIIEGLHALNPKIYAALPPERMLRIFISVSTNITDDGVRILSGRKLRFIRRMVRDSIYRAADARRTLGMWENVLAGEDKFLYPHRGNADIAFDTFHAFELGLMRPFVLELISEQLAAEDPYAKTVRAAAVSATEIKEYLVPENSLMREFIPGGIYEELY